MSAQMIPRGCVADVKTVYAERQDRASGRHVSSNLFKQ